MFTMNVAKDDVIARFGPYQLMPSKRQLEKDGHPLAIGSRALDILVLLVEKAGEVVTRRELLDRVWSDLTVEQSNIRVHVASLRRLLADGDPPQFIANVTGRGYCFIAPVEWVRSGPSSNRNLSKGLSTNDRLRLPALLTRMVGRDDTVRTLSNLLRSRRFVSIVGPGGMGKTTVAVSVAHAMREHFDEAVRFVDLGAISDPGLVPKVVAAQVDFPLPLTDPLEGLVAYLNDQRLLLVLDNCEHVVGAVAQLAERVFGESPQVHLLTTSREALRVEGEFVHRLQPLDIPSEDVRFSTDNALRSSAVQLFLDRAAASGSQERLDDHQMQIVSEICRRLDGIALAIELVASRVGTYGIEGTADLLNNRFKLLWEGRRSALPRHQTLHAMLDWSYSLLGSDERQLLERLSIFKGVFSLEAAEAVCQQTGMDQQDISEAFRSLNDKSLIFSSTVDGHTSFRLLDATRAFATIKLLENGDAESVAGLHANHFRIKLAELSDGTTIFQRRAKTLASQDIGNVRAALEWAFSPNGSARTGVELAAAAALLFLEASLLDECQRWCSKALEVLEPCELGTRTELALQAALSFCAIFTSGNGLDVRNSLERGLELAERLGSDHYQLDLLAGLQLFLTRAGEMQAAMTVSERCARLAKKINDPTAMVMADWMLGTSHHIVGDQAKAVESIERGLMRSTGANPVQYFGFHHRIRALASFARALWLRGFADRSFRFACQIVDEAKQHKHPVTLCIALLYATTIFHWIGDRGAEEDAIHQLLSYASRYSLRAFLAFGKALEAEFRIAGEDVEAGVAMMREVFPTLHAEGQRSLEIPFSRSLAEGMIACGLCEEAAAVINAVLENPDLLSATCDYPEALRVRGEIYLVQPEPDEEAAQACFQRGIEIAQQQSALAWELRSMMSLARLRAKQNQIDRACSELNEVISRFTEGHATRDLLAAQALLDELRRSGRID